MSLGLHVPERAPAFTRRIPGWCTVTNAQWRAFPVPQHLTELSFIVIGGGGSGAGGPNSAGGNQPGGGGGGSSAVTRVSILTKYLPKVLYLQVGMGGADPAGAVAGNAGILSYVAVRPDTTASNVIAVSGAAAATGGAVAGTAGAAGTIAAIGAMPLAGMGSFSFIAGQAGTAGVNAAAGANQTIPVTSVITMGGTGGGGTSAAAGFNGGGITAITNSLLGNMMPTVGGPLGTGVAAGDGSGGFEMMFPQFFFPGLGGGGSNTAVAGNGGPGSFGCGGGGGGAASGAVGGRGGRGGQGLIIIEGW